MSTRIANRADLEATVEAFRQRLVDNLWHIHGQAIQSADKHDAYMTLCYTVRDHLIERWRKTVEAQVAANPKCVCYLSAEYLLGKQLPQNMLYTDTTELARQALAPYGVDLDELMATGRRAGAGQRRLGPPGGLLPGFAGDAGHSGRRLRNSLRVWDFQANIPRRLASRTAGRVAVVRESVGVSSAQRHGASRIWRPCRTVYRSSTGTSAAVGFPRHSVFGEPCTTLVPGYGTTHGQHPAVVACPGDGGIRFSIVRRR